MSFNISLSGLNAASADLDVTGNNISNSSTVGFKESRAEFADVFASSQFGLAQNATGQGVRLQNVAQQFSQGQFDFTGNALDLGVNGTGFFRTSQDGEISYTRNGAFDIDQDGFIVNADNKRLTGFGADGDGNITGALEEVQVDTGNIPPQATTEVDLDANLQADAERPDAADTVGFDADDPSTFNESTSTTVFDAQGHSLLGSFYFTKADEDNEWEIRFGVEGDVSDPRTAVFDGSGNFEELQDDTGAVIAGGTDAFQFPQPGADDLEVEVDFTSLTQYGSPFSVNTLGQNGYEPGQFSDLDVEEDGTIFGRYTNGQSEILGQVALARFPSETSLAQAGDTSWVETAESGEAIVGAPGTSSLGVIESGALEQANVDIAEQLVGLITAQRSFQANAQAISTQDQVTQEILQIR